MNLSDDFLHPATRRAGAVVVAASKFCKRVADPRYSSNVAYSLPDGEYIANVAVHCITRAIRHRINNVTKAIWSAVTFVQPRSAWILPISRAVHGDSYGDAERLGQTLDGSSDTVRYQLWWCHGATPVGRALTSGGAGGASVGQLCPSRSASCALSPAAETAFIYSKEFATSFAGTDSRCHQESLSTIPRSPIAAVIASQN